jgi:uncharacterized membrane protein YccC
VTTESKTSERRLAATERQRQALELRKAGVGFVKIAEMLGYKGPSGAYEAVHSALRRTLQQPADDLRRLENERLDVVLQAIAVRVKAGDYKAIDRWLRACESRRKLEGLDAPVKVAATDPQGNAAAPADFRRRAVADDDARQLLALMAERSGGLEDSLPDGSLPEHAPPPEGGKNGQTG